MTQPRILGNRYELGRTLGHGGMAEVHEGRDVRLGRVVAVKVLRQDLARDPSFQARFRREAQAAASLNHPAIVAVYDTGEDQNPDGSGTTPYIIMEYVEGRTLRDVLKAESRLEPKRAMEIMADICTALDYSHRNGIVHRDVKPGNVMVTDAGTIKVMDFGIARAMTDSAATMTATAAVIGTAQYLSPEQARGETVDARSDVYSSGCVLYELLTGHPPFTGDSPVAVAYQHVRENPVPPSQANPMVPRDIDAIVLKAMAKNPANRYQSGAEMRADLVRAIAGRSVMAEPVMTEEMRTELMGPAAVGPPPMSPRRPPEPEDYAYGEEQKKRGATPYVLLGIGVIAVIAVVALIVTNLIGKGGDDGGTAAQTVSTPDLTDKTEDEAKSAITDLGLEVGNVDRKASTAEQEGKVIAQSPLPNSEQEKGDRVNFTIGSGPDTVTVPSGLVGLDVDEATQKLQDAQLQVTTQEEDSDQPEGTVVRTDPGEGDEVEPDTTVTLYVSNGKVSLPSVMGQFQDQALEFLHGQGFTNVSLNPQVSDQPEGTVIGQDPQGGTLVSKTDPVTLTVAVAPSQPTTNPPTGGATTEPGPGDPSSGGSTGGNGGGGRGDDDNSADIIGRILGVE